MLEISNRYLLQSDDLVDKASRREKPPVGKLSAAAGKGKKAGAGTAGAGGAAVVKAAAPSSSDKEGMSNTLIRLLQKVSASDIARLQEGVRNVSQYFQFYALDPTLRTDVTPPAVHLQPAGGALKMLDRALLQRKKSGIFDVNKRCQEERTRPGHTYIGNYPCEKRV